MLRLESDWNGLEATIKAGSAATLLSVLASTLLSQSSCCKELAILGNRKSQASRDVMSTSVVKGLESLETFEHLLGEHELG